MKISKKIIPSAVAASLLLSFTACGGGGGDSTSTPTSSTSSIAISGTAADGYIDGGTACLDLSLDGVCQSTSEPTTTTNATGVFSLDVTATHQAHANFSTAPVIVYGGVDIDTQKAFTGTMKAPYKNATDIVVSPLTTMVKALIDNSGKTEEEAKAAVATALGISADDVLKDPVQTPAITKAALSVQKSVELLAASNGGADTDTIYEQLAPAVVAVADANTSTGIGAVATEASGSSLTGSAATTASTGSVGLIENAVNAAITGTAAEQALVIESQTAAAIAAVEANAAADISTDIDNAETDVRVLAINNILTQTTATQPEKDTILALQGVIDLQNGTADITKNAISTIILNSDDATLLKFATELDSTVTQTILYEDITTDTTLTADKVWEISGLVKVRPGATLTIEPGTTIIAQEGNNYMVVMKGAKIMAEGTQANPIIFTSKVAHEGGTAEDGQWGGLTILGNAPTNQVAPRYEVDENDADFDFGGTVADDNSGVLTYVKILNSGAIVGTDTEINGLSLCGVGSGTTIDNIEVVNSSDDGVEVWGGTVNMSNLRIENALDDSLDLDFGYSGTVDGVEVVQGNIAHAGFEISSGGDNPMTMATIKNFTITKVSGSDEGGIYIKDDTTAPTFINGTVTTVGTDAALNVKLAMTQAQKDAMAFGNVDLSASSTLYAGAGATDGQAEVEANEGL